MRRVRGVEQVRGVPYLPRAHLMLHRHKVGEYSEDGGARGEHDEQPEIQLGFGPDVLSSRFEHFDDGCAGHFCFGGRGVFPSSLLGFLEGEI